MLVISFDTWEDFDNAIGDIASAFYKASVAEEDVECVECGESVTLPYTNPVTGGTEHLCRYSL